VAIGCIPAALSGVTSISVAFDLLLVKSPSVAIGCISAALSGICSLDFDSLLWSFLFCPDLSDFCRFFFPNMQSLSLVNAVYLRFLMA
jgi:hypothetical protein